MTKKTKIQHIKTFIKIFVASGLVVSFIILTFFVKHTHTFENFNMKKWTTLTYSQRVSTVHRVISDFTPNDLFMACMDKIATLPESDNMLIQSAVSLCYNGIKLNNVAADEQDNLETEKQNDNR